MQTVGVSTLLVMCILAKNVSIKVCSNQYRLDQLSANLDEVVSGQLACV